MSEGSDVTTFTIDPDFVIVHVDDAWLLFARQNDAPHLDRAAVLNRSLWDFISDMGTRYLYREVLTKVRSTRKPLSLDYRCDAPDLRRFMRMIVSPAPHDQLELRSVLIRKEPRSPIGITYMNEAPELSYDLRRMCSFCKKLQVDEDHWTEVEEAINKLKLFSSESIRITHGACPTCTKRIMAELED